MPGRTGVRNEGAGELSVELSPPLKWAGGKRWQIPHIAPIWEHYKSGRLVEPFCGGLAVTLGLRPRTAVVNDINPHVVNFYRQVRDGLSISIDLDNVEEAFYANRSRFNSLLREGRGQSAEAAALFYYLNRTGYNGLCRFNRSGEFNVPFGRYRQINYVRDFSQYRNVFAEWRFLVGDFSAVPIEAGDFVYADPPYDVEFTQYSQDGFSWDDQVRTAERLAVHEGPVILVNQATKRIVRLYKNLGFGVRYLEAPRRIACNGDRTPAREVFATRNI